jgi:imidazolonepropionase-like amidohydrolase
MAYRIRGTVLPEGEVREVYVTGGRFTFDPIDGAELLLEDVILIPGLVDAHAHLALGSPAPEAAPIADRVAASARAQLDAGVLLVREPGSIDHSSVGVGPSVGLPRTVTAGRFLAPPGRYFPGRARQVSAEELPSAAEEELRASGAWVKVIGDSPLPGPGLTATFDAQALTEAAARVHAAGGRIAIHCSNPQVIQDAIEAGFDSLEHGTGLRADQVEAVAERGIAWVPTRSIEEGIREMIHTMGWPAAEIRIVENSLDRQPEILCQAVEAGVPVFAGTDAGMGPHGMIRHEIELLRSAGLPPDVALGAASWAARAWLGLPGIEEGAPADLLAFTADPREHPSILATPAAVILDGRLVKDPRTSAD